MTATPWRQMTPAERASWAWDHWKLGLPVLIVVLAAALMTLPVFAPLPVMPNLAVLLVLLWSVYRPQQMPDWTGFIAGLACDVLLGAPIGANALLLPILMVTVTYADSRVRRVRWTDDWLFSIPMLLLYHAALWKILEFAGQPVPFLPLATQCAATIAVYPFVAHVFARAQRKWAP